VFKDRRQRKMKLSAGTLTVPGDRGFEVTNQLQLQIKQNAT